MAASETIYDVLRASHQRQRALCTRFVRAKDTKKREAIFRELRIELAAHAAAEERYLYAPILMFDAGLDSSRHALSEHHDMDELVEDLRALNTAGDAWSAKAAELAHKVRHHLKEEETKFFQVSGKLLTEKQKVRLAAQYERDFVRMQKVAARA